MMDTISPLSQARQAVLEVRGEVLIYLVYLSGQLILPVVKKKKKKSPQSQRLYTMQSHSGLV